MFEEVAEDVIIDYNGNSALSAYAPITIFNDTTWALLVEIDQARGKRPHKIYDEVHTDNRGGMAIGVALLALVFAGGLAKQVGGEPAAEVTDITLKEEAA